MSDMRSATRRLLLLACLNVLAADVLLPLLFSTPWRENALDHTRRLLCLRPTWDDSWTPMRRALAQLRSGRPELLYQAVFFRQKIKFQYPPTSLLFLYPFTPDHRTVSGATSEEAADILLKLLSAGMIVAGLYCVVCIFRRASAQVENADHAGPAREGFVAAAVVWTCLTLSFYPIAKAYTLGQIQAWINALFAAALCAWLADCKKTCGILIGFICLIKPHYALLVFWGVLRRQWGFVGSVVAVGLAGLVVSVALFGLANHLDYLAVVSFLGRHGEAYYPNQSVNGLLNRLLGNGSNLDWQGWSSPPFSAPVYLGTLGSSLLLLVLALCGPFRRSARGSAFDFALMALTSTIASPVAWEHHYGILVPIYALLAPCLARPSGFRGAAAIGLCVSYFLTANFFPFLNRLADTPWNFLQSCTLAGALVLLVLLHGSSIRTGGQPSGTQSVRPSSS